jgi:hypothetical protein
MIRCEPVGVLSEDVLDDHDRFLDHVVHLKCVCVSVCVCGVGVGGGREK